jgi:hypothetical protein
VRRREGKGGEGLQIDKGTSMVIKKLKKVLAYWNVQGLKSKIGDSRF